VSDKAHNANQFISNSRSQWSNLVHLARETPPNQRDNAAVNLARAAGVGKSTLKRKLEAIHMAQAAGLPDEQLIQMGQAAVIGKFVKDKSAARDDEQVVLKWLVSPQIRDDVHRLFWNIGKTLGRKTSEELWDFILGVFLDLGPEEIHHLAGNGEMKRKHKCGSRQQ
jgi:hypothetical protein